MKRPPFAKDAVAGEGTTNKNQNAASPTPNPSLTARNLWWIEDPSPGIRFDLVFPNGLILRGCTLRGDALNVYNPPARADGWHVTFPAHTRKDRDGKESYHHIVDFANGSARIRILKGAVEAVRVVLEGLFPFAGTRQ